jgi:hypothetical protein
VVFVFVVDVPHVDVFFVCFDDFEIIVVGVVGLSE